jgi:hypothetical protein
VTELCGDEVQHCGPEVHTSDGGWAATCSEVPAVAATAGTSWIVVVSRVVVETIAKRRLRGSLKPVLS